MRTTMSLVNVNRKAIIKFNRDPKRLYYYLFSVYVDLNDQRLESNIFRFWITDK